jgi:hypothetical protein
VALRKPARLVARATPATPERISGYMELEPVTEVGEGTKVAAVQDPFGNRVGIIENPHFKIAGVP